MEKAYVFVVCGNREHIDTLHFSLKSFKKNTSFPSIIVTDRNRNEIPVIHENIIHIDTPKELTHHQAAIYLKTSLHRYLSKNGRYVYMDSDILAIGDNCDAIFDEYIPPIRFAPDHCTLPFFSPTAINCSCQKDFDKMHNEIRDYINKLDFYGHTDDLNILEQRAELKKRITQVFSNKPLLIQKGLKGFFSWSVFYFDKDFKYNRKEKLWYNSDGVPIMLQVDWSKVAKKMNLRFDYFRMQIKDKKGKPIWACQCEHLPKEIQSKFGVKVKNKKWQHWNGGVFLFGEESHEFLDFWHSATIEIFKDSNWKIRDQGTLVATAWKFGLQNHPLLDEKWNNICDYNYPDLSYRESDNSIVKDGKTYIKTEFAHVYHHFGDDKWEFWQKISKGF